LVRHNGQRVYYEAEAAYTTEYQAVLDAMTTDPTGDTLTWQNDMVYSLDTAGIWDNLDVFYVCASNNEDNAKINWINPGTFDITDPGTTAPTFTRFEGWTGDGSSDYLSTNYNPFSEATYYLINDCSFGGYFRSLGASTDAFFGSSAANHVERYSATYRFEVNGNDATTYPLFSAGLFYADRALSTEAKFFSNGSLDQTDAHNSGAIPNADFVILNNNSTGFSSGQISIFFAGGSLADKAASFNTIIETYMDAIGKGVQ
jgi:hypothetical protein